MENVGIVEGGGIREANVRIRSPTKAKVQYQF